MKNKKLIVIFCVFVAVVMIIVLSSTIFTFRRAELYFINEDGQYVEPGEELTGHVDLEACLDGLYGKNIVLLGKSEITRRVESANLRVKVERIEKVFPDRIRIYATVRVPLYYLTIDGNVYVMSYDGFVMAENPDSLVSVVKVVDPNLIGTVDKPVVGEYISSKFNDGGKYEIIEKFFNSVWRQEGFDYAGIYNLIKSVTLGEDKLTCVTQRGATFVILSPDADLFEKFTSIYGAYTANPDKQENGVFTTGAKAENGYYSVSVGGGDGKEEQNG